MVRCYPILPSAWNPKPETRYINRFDSPPTGGLFTKVSPKPTNHSKYTGKCNRPRCAGCHMHPARKSKDKAKGTQKLYGLCLEFAGVSSREILNDLDGGGDDDTDEESFPYDTLAESLMHQNVFLKAKVNEDDDVDAGDDDNDEHEQDDEEKMSFCDVGLVWEEVDGDEE
ncbi:hypothetical protein F0562_004559 [Nyssa sinensis]|uniref:Uncharacterized protein n=1 Tax=Nyssa sinensis TaxID=561372 RepID=A0A5J5C217_9ASTE|nr:hypothetical protein F0562_004559 [Nyssa sinensis]